jgi:hypothetical protein
MCTEICTHCGEPQRGSAGVQRSDGYYPLCHPDDGMDCYRLVTVYQHVLTNCAVCAPRAQPLTQWVNLMRPAPGYARCCICFEARPFDELLLDQSTNQRWDICGDGTCAEEAGLNLDGSEIAR